jgi:hypothetical protein
MKVSHWLTLVNEMFSLTEVTIRISGNEASKRMFEFFTQPHPRYKVIQNKRWGAGLFRLPERFEDYIKGKDKQTLRTNRRRSLSLGHRFDAIEPSRYLNDILAINKSLQIRQGQPMDADYLNLERLETWIKDKPEIYGVSDRYGVLKAYAYAPVHGEVFILSRLLGHADELENGIMYLLISEVVREMIERKHREGIPLWAMYDTFFGASPGLRFFKERLGFRPYKVRWVWKP